MAGRFIVVMGVSGTGKSTLGAALAEALNVPFVEGDSLHPPSNVEKMTNEMPLTDEDRLPWLELVRATAEEHLLLLQEQQQELGSPKLEGVVVSPVAAIITCSALKRRYRDVLRNNNNNNKTDSDCPTTTRTTARTTRCQCEFVFIKGDRELIWERMEKRQGHYMKPSMLDGQFGDLESPEGEDGVVAVVDARDTTERQVQRVVAAILGRRLDLD